MFEHPAAPPSAPRCSPVAGKIVTCAATSGYMIEYDNRHPLMKLKSIVSSHFANYKEARAANQLVAEGKIQPLPSKTYRRADRRGRLAVHKNEIEGKAGVLRLAPRPASASTTPEFREKVGEDKIISSSRRQPSDGPRSQEPASRTTTRSTWRPRRWRLAHRDRPHRHRRRGPSTHAIADYRETFDVTVDHREIVESDGVEEALLKVAGQLHPAVHPHLRGLAGGQVPRQEGLWACTTSATAADCAQAPRRSRPPATVLDEEPRPGSRGTTVAFVTPRPSTVRAHRARRGVAPSGLPVAATARR
ncbi:MAG: hypothetical protein R2746_02210 [Acidimicrobiales bacterium]